MKKTIAFGAFGLVAFATLGLGTAAHATEDTAPKTKEVAWIVTSGDFANRFASPQTIFTGKVGECGQPPLQVDLWKYDTPEHITTADQIVASGELSAPNGVPQDSSIFISNVDLPATPACETEPTPAPTTETPVPPVTSEPTPTDTPKPVDTPAPVESTPPASPEPTAKPSAPVKQATATATGTATAAAIPVTGGGDSDQLAFTGVEHTALKLGVAGSLLGGGLLLRIVRRRWNRANAVVDGAPVD